MVRNNLFAKDVDIFKDNNNVIRRIEQNFSYSFLD